MGGLTVLAALQQRLPNESFLYLGDTARLPYGTKSPATVQRYAEQAAALLLQRGVKAVVVACNTASGLALAHLQTKLAPVPVFGVVEPGAEAAAAAAEAAPVLVVATESTVRGGAYQRALLQRNPGLQVYARACPLWVTLAEQGPGEAPLIPHVLEHDLRGFLNGPAPVQTLLLGCTHFPVFAATLRQRYPQVTVVDSASTTAAQVQTQLQALGLLDNDDKASQVHFLATDGGDRFRRVGSYFLGHAVPAVEVVDLAG